MSHFGKRKRGRPKAQEEFARTVRAFKECVKLSGADLTTEQQNAVFQSIVTKSLF
jgi:hypothetical protein